MASIQERLAQVAGQYADRRTTIFDVQLDTTQQPSILRGRVLDADQFAQVQVLLHNEAGIDNQVQVLLDGPDYSWATVALGVLDVRVAGSHRVERSSQAIYGEAVECLQRQDDWCLVRLRDGYLGWVPQVALVPGSAEVAQSFQDHATHVVITRWQPVMALTGEQMGMLPYGTVLPILEFRGGMAFFVSPDGKPCSVHAENLISVHERPSLDREGCKELIELMRRFVGVPYLWGGVTPFGFDCSGLTQTAYRYLGYTLPRDSDLQATVGQSVARETMEPGDLVFWSDSPPESDSYHINHVALAVDTTNVVHATRQRWAAVVVEPIKVIQERYSKLGQAGLVDVRRIIED